MDNGKLTYFINEENKYSSSWQYNGSSHLISHDYSIQPTHFVESPESSDESDIDITQIFKDRMVFQKLSTTQVFYLIKERESLRDNNIDSIKSREMYCHEKLSQLNMAKRYISQPQVHFKRIDGLQRLLFDLEKQERSERIFAWRDILSLKLSLPEMLKEYQTLKRQEVLLGDVT